MTSLKKNVKALAQHLPCSPTPSCFMLIFTPNKMHPEAGPVAGPVAALALSTSCSSNSCGANRNSVHQCFPHPKENREDSGGHLAESGRCKQTSPDGSNRRHVPRRDQSSAVKPQVGGGMEQCPEIAGCCHGWHGAWLTWCPVWTGRTSAASSTASASPSHRVAHPVPRSGPVLLASWIGFTFQALHQVSQPHAPNGTDRDEGRRSALSARPLRHR